MHQQRRHRGSDKVGEKNIRRGGQEEERTDRGERERTARQTGTWLWQERVRAEENQGRRSCRYAKHAGCGRFLATGEEDHLGALDRLSGRGSLQPGASR